MRKSIYIVAISLLAFLLFACAKEEQRNVIPIEPVNFQINFVLDTELRGAGGFKTFTSPRLGAEHIGYGGLLVINSFYATNAPDLLAYDLSCPSEARRDVLVKPASDGTAKCSKCGRVYDLMANGKVKSESSNLHMQRYNVVSTSNRDVFYVTR